MNPDPEFSLEFVDSHAPIDFDPERVEEWPKPQSGIADLSSRFGSDLQEPPSENRKPLSEVFSALWRRTGI